MMWSKADVSSEQPTFVERRRWPRISQVPLCSGTQGVPQLVSLPFSTRDLGLDQQFPAWQDRMAPLIDMRLPENAKVDDCFQVNQTVWNLEGVLLIQQATPAFSYERSAEKVRFSSVDHWQITFLRTGRTWTGVNGRVAENEPGMMEIRTLGYPFYGRTLSAESVTLILPYDLFADRGGLPGASNNVVFSGARVKLLSDYVAFLEANLDRLTRDDLQGVRSQLREMVFHCVAPLMDCHMVNDQTSQIGLMTRARRFIQNNLGSEDLTPETLSRELAISRTRLYELFQTSGGVLNYIRKRRLLAARAAIADPADNRKIIDIASKFGFDSAANFSRAFTHEFGYSPSEVRKHMGELRIEHPPHTEELPTFDSWLSTLGL
ncbi:helix-turn-helix domain-containing protein [Agrobacterium rhizogenes]|uniref:helix-turn-helix domain-containing protein n=1 Tax=Rhizobium rhizogenes TaxID=359 RepID=UPI001574007F|nr:helix-turn-helix domain-containing protein [Rhizobium rhizogenes]NTF91063.1 helix-turn-helix domain-containing protein [Rhizobium rhizogenes]